MRFTIERAKALEGLAYLAGIVNGKSEIPILGNLKVEAEGDAVRITGTDLDVLGAVLMPARVEREGATTIEADRFFQIVRALPEGADFTADLGDGLMDRLSIKAGRSNFKVATLPAADYPGMYSGAAEVECELKASILSRLLATGGMCADPADKRWYIPATFLHTVEDRLRVASTDGKAVCYCESAAPAGFHLPRGVMLPPKAVTLLRKLLANVSSDDTIRMECTGGGVVFSTETVRLACKVFSGDYVDYARVMSGDHKPAITLDTDMFIGCLRRAAIMSDAKDHGVRLDVSEGVLKVSARNDMGEHAEEVEAGYGGEPERIGANAVRLLEILEQVRTENVLLAFPDGNMGVSIGETGDNSDWRAILAPLKG